MNYMNIQKTMTFDKALILLKNGESITNSRGNIYYLSDNKVFSIPKNQYPKGKREEVKLYWDAILDSSWEKF